MSWVGHGNEHTLSLLACAFVALRVIYIGLYVADVAALRSVVSDDWDARNFCRLYLLPLFS